MSDADFLDGGKELQAAAAAALNEVEAQHGIATGKEEAAELAKRRAAHTERRKRRLWRRKQLVAYIRGFARFALMCAFAVLVYQTQNKITLITESWELRNAICSQILRRPLSEAPAFYRRLEDIHEALGDYQEALEDPNNIIFEQNKLMPWVQVQVLRVNDKPCEASVEARRGPGAGTCSAALHSDDFDTTDFDGATYMAGGGTRVRTRYRSLPNGGQAKSYRITDDSGRIIWREALQNEVFRTMEQPKVVYDSPIAQLLEGVSEIDGSNAEPDILELERLKDMLPQPNPLGPIWSDDPTRAMVWTLHFLNDQLGLLMEVKVVVVKTDGGLYTVDFATQRARLPINDAKTWRLMALGAFINAVLLAVTLLSIRQERWEQELVEAE